MRLLAIETATEGCSVALWNEGEVRERFEIAPRRHAELVLPWAQALLAEAGIAKSQLDAIAVGRGPGAFTGVRLAIALAQGIALALDRPVVPISTLAVLAMHDHEHLAQTADPRVDERPNAALSARPHRCARIVAAIDARMGEIYLGAYARDDDGLVEALDAERLLPPAAARLAPGEQWFGVGTGFAAEGGALVLALDTALATADAAALPHAAHLARLAVRGFARGEAVAPERVEPAYLRDKVALTLAEQQASRKRSR